jgi:hypothetical protein
MSRTQTFVGLFVILLGLDMLFDINLFRILFPLIIIWFGFTILTGRKNMDFSKVAVTDEDFLKRVLIFSGINTKITSKAFGGGEVVAIFGGGEIDITEVQAAGSDIKIDLVAIFGSLKIRVPENWVVQSGGVGILGGFNNSTTAKKGRKVAAKIEGVAILGGVEIAN